MNWSSWKGDFHVDVLTDTYDVNHDLVEDARGTLCSFGRGKELKDLTVPRVPKLPRHPKMDAPTKKQPGCRMGKGRARRLHTENTFVEGMPCEHESKQGCRPLLTISCDPLFLDQPRNCNVMCYSESFSSLNIDDKDDFPSLSSSSSNNSASSKAASPYRDPNQSLMTKSKETESLLSKMADPLCCDSGSKTDTNETDSQSLLARHNTIQINGIPLDTDLDQLDNKMKEFGELVTRQIKRMNGCLAVRYKYTDEGACNYAMLGLYDSSDLFGGADGIEYFKLSQPRE